MTGDKSVIVKPLQSNKEHVSILIFSDIYKVLDDVLGQGAHTIVKSCVKLVTNQEYAVKVGKFLFNMIIARERYCHFMGYISMCRHGGYGFQAVWSRIGYRDQRV